MKFLFDANNLYSIIRYHENNNNDNNNNNKWTREQEN